MFSKCNIATKFLVHFFSFWEGEGGGLVMVPCVVTKFEGKV